MTRRPTFRELAKLEPRLADLLAEARQVADPGDPATGFCANGVWYRCLKPRLCALVGWDAPEEGPPLLRTSAAYDVAYQVIYEALPDCRNCGCFGAP